MIAVRERIRINSQPISEALFAKYFFEVWDALEYSAIAEGRDPQQKPVYFRFLTLMSFHVFVREEVDAAIYEVGIGGELDSTNIIENPVVTGISTLGIDHEVTLGDTIDKIAWHKAGIFKTGCPAISVEQLPDAMTVLKQRAAEKDVSLSVVGINPKLSQVDIAPDEDFQRTNASLAIALTTTLLSRFGVAVEEQDDRLADEFATGLETVVWRGRCETKIEGNREWYMDGAHTTDSIRVAGTWFAKILAKKRLDDSSRSSFRSHVISRTTLSSILRSPFSVLLFFSLCLST